MTKNASLPGGTVAVVQRRGLLVLDAVPRLLGQDLVLALVEILVDGTGQLRLCSAWKFRSVTAAKTHELKHFRDVNDVGYLQRPAPWRTKCSPAPLYAPVLVLVLVLPVPRLCLWLWRWCWWRVEGLWMLTCCWWCWCWPLLDWESRTWWAGGPQHREPV